MRKSYITVNGAKIEYILPWHRELSLKLKKILRRLRWSIKLRGLSATVYLAIKSLKSLFWLDRQVMMFDIRTADPFKRAEVDDDVEYRELEARDLKELVQFSIHFGSRELQHRLERGDLCHIAKINGKIVFYGWAAVGKIYVPMLGKHIDRGPEWVYFYNTYTDPSFRDISLLPTFMTRMHEYCEKNGYPYGYTLVDIELGLPIAAYMKLTGAYKITSINYKRIFGRKSYVQREISRQESIELSRYYKKRCNA